MNDQHTAPGVVELAGLLAPSRTVTETSHPTPTLGRWNVAVLVDHPDDARNAVLALEDLESDSAAVGLTTLSPASVAAETTEGRARLATDGGAGAHEQGAGFDREGVVKEIAPRTIVGAVIGAVVGALVVGVAAFLIAGTVGAIAGGIGGALLGAPIGGVWGGFARMGGSDAYRQTFVDPADPSTFMVSLHTSERSEADEAAERLGLVGSVVRAGYDGERLTLDG